MSILVFGICFYLLLVALYMALFRSMAGLDIITWTIVIVYSSVFLLSTTPYYMYVSSLVYHLLLQKYGQRAIKINDEKVHACSKDT